MGMVATLGGELVEAWHYDRGQWTELQATYRDRDLRMTCGMPAIPKTSPRGLRFFAHTAGENCGLHLSGPETAEHQAAKRVLADAARAAGWEATVEAVNEDRTWIADVLIEHAGVRVALEVQWSPQPEGVFGSRSARYEADGVRCTWFTGPVNHGRAPDAYMLHGTADRLAVTVPGALGDRPVTVPLHDGARALFSGQVRAAAELRADEATVGYMMSRCYREECRSWYSRWFIVSVEATSRCQRRVLVDLETTGHGLLRTPGGLELPSAGRGVGWGPEWGAFAVSRPEHAAAADLVPLLGAEDMPAPCAYAWRSSTDVPAGYVAALCPKCGAMQGDAFVLQKPPLIRTVTVPWRASLTLAGRPGTRHWCTDAGYGRCTGPEQAMFPAPHQTVSIRPC